MNVRKGALISDTLRSKSKVFQGVRCPPTKAYDEIYSSWELELAYRERYRQMRVEQPNAIQKLWREKVRAKGSCIDGGTHHIQIHHPFGRTAKIKSVGNIGHFCILAFDPYQHALVDKGEAGLRDLKNDYLFYHPGEEDQVDPLSLHEFEKYLFAKSLNRISPPFDCQVYAAIMEYHR